MFSLITLFFIFSISNAQIKVSTSGTVSVGSTANATKALEVSGDAAISGDVSIGGATIASGYSLNSTSGKFTGDVLFQNGIYYVPSIIVQDYGYGGMSIRPTTDNFNYIGYSNFSFKKMYCYDYYNPSDARKKENIETMQNSLELVLKFQTVKYDLKPEYVFQDGEVYPAEIKEKLEKERKNKIGYLAQDVEKILPQLVDYNDSTDTYAVNYIGLIPLLSDAIQEQQLIIESLQNQLSAINTLQVKESNLKSISSVDEDNLQLDEIILYQNSPNPFSEETKIEYKIPSTTNNARIILHDMTGKQLNSYELHDNGASSITIYSGELIAGMYMYSLLVDGMIIDTKQMIITE